MPLIILAHNIRSTHNVGAILRTADGFGVEKVILSGYTPYPTLPGDKRLAHEHEKLTRQIHKTALGAEETVTLQYAPDVRTALGKLKDAGFTLAALEQAAHSIKLPEFTHRPEKLALLLGEEVHGVEPDILQLCDVILEIPMVGTKESFNVSVAAGIAMYELTKK